MVPKPIAGQLSVVAQSEAPISNLVPVYVAITNGTDQARTIHLSQLFALDHYDQRIAPMPPSEAARQAGGVDKLESAVKQGVIGGQGAGAVSGGQGASASPSEPATSAKEAAPGKNPSSKNQSPKNQAAKNLPAKKKSPKENRDEIEGLSLNDAEIQKDSSASGFIFFPRGSYTGLEMGVKNNQTGATETITLPWH